MCYPTNSEVYFCGVNKSVSVIINTILGIIPNSFRPNIHISSGFDDIVKFIPSKGCFKHWSPTGTYELNIDAYKSILRSILNDDNRSKMPWFKSNT